VFWLRYRTAVEFGWFLVAIGLLFLLYQIIPWETLTPEDRAILLISSGLILLACYFALGWVRSQVGREIVRGVNTFTTILAFLTILLSLTYFFPPLALLTQMGTEEATRAGHTSISVGNASKVGLQIDLMNGDVLLKGSDVSQILIDYEIITRGISKAAVANLNKTQLYVSDSLVDGQLSVKIRLTGPELNKLWSKVKLAITLPRDLPCDLTFSSMNGRLNISSIFGSRLSAEITNGEVRLSKAGFEEVDVSITNGEIDASISSNELDFELINGKISLEILNDVPGEYCVNVVNGDVVIKCNADEGKGFEFKVETMHGSIDMGFEEFEFIKWEDGKKVEARTKGYSLTGLRIRILVDVINGSVEIRP